MASLSQDNKRIEQKTPDPLKLLEEFVAAPGPPGQEDRIRSVVARRVAQAGHRHATDAKGNLLVSLSESSKRPRVVVTAHLDEIAMIVRGIDAGGSLTVGALGGLLPWKLGEGPVQILTQESAVSGVLSFGSIHTEDPSSTVRMAKESELDWPMVSVLTGLSSDDLETSGVRVGSRVVVAESRRSIARLGEWVASYFLDDRADLVAWVLALRSLAPASGPALFAATAAEEVGGHGALYLLQEHRPEVCIALELGPAVADAPVELSDQPTVWVNDSYAAMNAQDVQWVSDVGSSLGLELQFQALSRGGSDASCAASHGLCARPITLGLPMANSHGFEVMHPGAMEKLGELTAALVRNLSA